MLKNFLMDETGAELAEYAVAVITSVRTGNPWRWSIQKIPRRVLRERNPL